MQNMNSNSESYTTTTAASNTTSNATSADAGETERPTLAELLTERAEGRQQQEMVRAQQRQQEQERMRREALDFVVTWSLSHISDDLRAALRMTWAVDDNRLDVGDNYGEYESTDAGYATIELADCGIDDGEDARSDPNRDERWKIVRYGYNWTLCGPHGYRSAISDNYQLHRNVDAEILDALAAYPAWLIGEAEKRADAEQERIAVQYAEEQTHSA